MDLLERLKSNTTLYPPMQPFTSPDHHLTVSSVLAHCQRLAGGLAWLEDMMNAPHLFAFFGGAVYVPNHTPKDVDVLFFCADGPNHMSVFPPKFIHFQKIYENEHTFGISINCWKFLVAHALLIHPTIPPDFVLKRIEQGRDMIRASPFFNGGIGDLLLYGAFKEHEDFFDIKWSEVDGATMMNKSITLAELHTQIKRQMCGMEDHEIMTLTKAAMRRMRVNNKKREALGKRFFQELRKLQFQ
ncbi:hypothetical protein KKB44_03135 [Candidatus Micrarchaeota archaeon]|nr:hypothetical protein [Candidatus Micrarchaeota archaeon]